jgi:carbonic anhydrase
MKKLIKGIMEFRRTKRDGLRGLYAQLALGQRPDCLYITCSDSRVVANIFASTDPGDLFVIRNLGNIMPPAPDMGSAVAALEFALVSLQVGHIIVCGHSDCGAMRALAENPQVSGNTAMSAWLRHAKAAVEAAPQGQDALSMRNVSLQLQNLRSHPLVREREAAGKLKLHGLWFNIREVEVHYLEKPPMGFTLIDDVEGQKILENLGD